MTDTETGVDSPQQKKKKEEKLKYSFKTLESYPKEDYCHYSGLPSPSAYETDDENIKENNK
tara:strand:+ start:3193 stop:3375 length:183 start_codon:yes stop_codon:yes gene_type:complete